MEFLSATWHHTHYLGYSSISMITNFFCLHGPNFVFESNHIYMQILNVVNVLSVFQSPNLLSVVQIMCVVWLESCAKRKCIVLKLERVFMSCILKQLCLNIFKCLCHTYLNVCVYNAYLNHLKVSCLSYGTPLGSNKLLVSFFFLQVLYNHQSFS